MRRPFLTISPSRRCLCPLRLLILQSLRSPRAKSEIFASLFSISCKHFFTLFHSLQKSETPSPFFSITSTLFARVPGQPPPRQKTLSSFRPSARDGQPRGALSSSIRLANWSVLWSLSLFRHIVTSLLSAEKPYPTPYHLMAKRYRTVEEVYTSSCREAKSCNPLLQSF